jgi:hypothetical protein
MPLRTGFYLAVMRRWRILDDATHPAWGELVLKFPVGVALKVQADEKAFAKRDIAKRFPLYPGFSKGRKSSG